MTQSAARGGSVRSPGLLECRVHRRAGERKVARSMLLLKALEAAREAAAIIHRHYRAEPDVRIKADGSPVTIADEQAEQAIKAVLLKAFPAHDFLGEESGRS